MDWDSSNSYSSTWQVVSGVQKSRKIKVLSQLTFAEVERMDVQLCPSGWLSLVRGMFWALHTQNDKHPCIIFYSFVTSFCARSHSHDCVPGSLHFVSYHIWFRHIAVSESRHYSLKNGPHCHLLPFWVVKICFSASSPSPKTNSIMPTSWPHFLSYHVIPICILHMAGMHVLRSVLVTPSWCLRFAFVF